MRSTLYINKLNLLASTKKIVCAKCELGSIVSQNNKRDTVMVAGRMPVLEYSVSFSRNSPLFLRFDWLEILKYNFYRWATIL